jgi:uncharacterized protein
MEINTQPNTVSSRIWMVLGILGIVFLALLIIDKGYNVKESIRPSYPKNTISITADGKASGTPDLATISVGVASSAATAKAAQDNMTKKVNDVTAYVKSQGIDEKDITTSNFSIYPSYDYNNGQKISGYNGNETVTIKVRGVDTSTDRLGKVLSGAVENGSNQISGIYFSFDDTNALKQQARKDAIEKAKQKAQELAGQTGLKLGRIVTVSDYESPSYQPYPMDSFGRGGANQSAPVIEPGNQDILSSVTVTFEVK